MLFIRKRCINTSFSLSLSWFLIPHVSLFTLLLLSLPPFLPIRLLSLTLHSLLPLQAPLSQYMFCFVMNFLMLPTFAHMMCHVDC